MTGGRDYHNEHVVNTILNIFHRRVRIDCLVHGGAMGADYLCKVWAADNNVPQKEYLVTKTDYDRFGRGAPLIRNCKMLDHENPNMLCAFPGKNGTAHMMDYAIKQGVPIYDVQNDRVIKPRNWKWDFRDYMKYLGEKDKKE